MYPVAYYLLLFAHFIHHCNSFLCACYVVNNQQVLVEVLMVCPFAALFHGPSQELMALAEFSDNKKT